MATFAQTTIHSKIAKFQKEAVNDGSLGKVYRGTLSHFGKMNRTFNKINDEEILRQVQILPKTKMNIQRKMRNKVIPSMNKKEQIILMESSVFPAIYFKKTTMRNVLREFHFPDNVKSMSSNDDRMPLIFQIVSNIFNQITFYLFNILIGQNKVSQNYYVFFSDSQTIPFTKCCNAPVYIQLINNGSGKILCNSLKCPHPNLAQFLINFQDGKKLWHTITYFSQASEKDRQLKHRISKLIHNGKYRRVHLANVVEDTSKQIVELFYHSKNKKAIQQNQPEQPSHDINQYPFLTSGPTNLNQIDNQKQEENVISMEDIISPEEDNIELLKMKIQYITQNSVGSFNKDLTRDLVHEGKVFHKNFEMIKKIDEFMINHRRSKHSTLISFPKIMEKMKKQNNKTSKSHSLYNVRT